MPYYNRDPKRDHNFDNHPFEVHLGSGIMRCGWGVQDGVGFLKGLGFRV